MAAAHGNESDIDAARRDAARRTISDCDHRLGKYRQLLDEGADPKIVAKWMGEVQDDRLDAETVLANLRPQQVLTVDDVRQMVDEVEDKVKMLAEADPEAKAALYSALGIRLTYDHQRKVIAVESQPRSWALDRVGGGTRNNALRPFDAPPAWGSPQVRAGISGNPVREVGVTDLWLPAA
jgi:hypothetical protein